MKDKTKVYMPKNELTKLIDGLVIENMLDWKSTTSVTTKEWNKLNKELDFLIGQFKKGKFTDKIKGRIN
jgi:hypothetical protein